MPSNRFIRCVNRLLCGVAALLMSLSPATAAEKFSYNVFWVHRTDVGSPGKRFGHAMAFDSVRGVTVFFGGEFSEPGGASNFYNDTWEYDGFQWQPIILDDGVKPDTRSEHTMCFDPVSRQVILFGGFNEDNFLKDLWTYTSTGPGRGRWQRQTDLPALARAGHAMVFDTWRQTAVITGGRPDPNEISFETTQECWEWIVSTGQWRAVPGAVGFSGGVTQGAGLRDHDMVFDPVTGDTYVGGGIGPYGTGPAANQRWWIRPGIDDPFLSASFTDCSIQLANSTMVYFPPRDAFVRFGGNWYPLDPDGGSLYSFELDEFRYSGWPCVSRPIENFPLVNPPGRTRHALVYDSRRQVAVIFGGGGDNGAFDDTWELVPYVPGEIWVNFAHQDTENGTANFPFNTLAEGVAATPNQGVLRIIRGSTPETTILSRPMTLQAVGGPVIIGE